MQKISSVLLGAVLGLFLLAGCGTLNMEKHYREYKSDLYKRKFRSADKYIAGQKKKFYKSEKNRLLYYMDRGTVLHLAGDYKQSNKFLEKAKQAAEDLWTESVGEHAAAWLTTDNSLSYQGEDDRRGFRHVPCRG